MAGKFRLTYSATSSKQIKKLHPHLIPIVKARIEQISSDPYIGKLLEKELSGYLSFRAKRYRIVYKVQGVNRHLSLTHHRRPKLTHL